MILIAIRNNHLCTIYEGLNTYLYEVRKDFAELLLRPSLLALDVTQQTPVNQSQN